MPEYEFQKFHIVYLKNPLNNKNLREIGYNKSVKNLIIHQSKLAQI